MSIYIDVVEKLSWSCRNVVVKEGRKGYDCDRMDTHKVT